MKLLDNYERSASVSEQYTPEEITEISLFLDAVLETQVMKVQAQFLDQSQFFKKRKIKIWKDFKFVSFPS